jgi:chromosome segregation ATPase
MIRRVISIREGIAMAFFKRELGPVERFEVALREKQATRQKLADRLKTAEALLEEKRAAAEKLAVAGASNSRLDRADADMRAVEDRVKAQRAALAEVDEQVASAERALADVTTQRDRDTAASGIEAMAAAIEQAAPGFGAGAAALVEAVTKNGASVQEATRFAASVEAVRREILSAADLICWELRSAAVQTRAGNMNIGAAVVAEPDKSWSADVERQLIYTLNPLQ